MREIKFNYVYSDGESTFTKSFSMVEIEGGYPFDEICDSPLLKDYKIIARRQYTGIKDANGVEIYEGDIVHVVKGKLSEGRHEIWSIEYGYFGDAAFYVQNFINSGRPIETMYGDPTFNIDGKAETPIIVVGNIHQMPELLERLQ